MFMKTLSKILAVMITAATLAFGGASSASAGDPFGGPGDWSFGCQGEDLVSELSMTNDRNAKQRIRFVVHQYDTHGPATAHFKKAVITNIAPGDTFKVRDVIADRITYVRVSLFRNGKEIFAHSGTTDPSWMYRKGDCWNSF